jgi:hypothetical protein
MVPIDGRTPASLQRRRNTIEVYGHPWSDSWTTFAGRHSAMLNEAGAASTLC